MADPEFMNFVQQINAKIIAENDDFLKDFYELMARAELAMKKRHMVSLAIGELAKQLYEMRRENLRLKEQVATYQRALRKDQVNATVPPTAM